MFGDFLRRLTEPDPAPLPDTDARLALSALLVRVARSDNEYASSERKMIQDITEGEVDIGMSGHLVDELVCINSGLFQLFAHFS